MSESLVPKSSNQDWTPLGPQRITAWRTYKAPDGHTSVVEESPEVTDEMVERGLRKMYGDPYIDGLKAEEPDDWWVEKQREMRATLAAALSTGEASDG